jgi:hypothetical protein
LRPIAALLWLLPSHHDFVLVTTVPKAEKGMGAGAVDAVCKRSTLASDSIQINQFIERILWLFLGNSSRTAELFQ